MPNFWRDPASGIGYQVQVEVPFALVKSGKDLEVVPVAPHGSGSVLLRDVAALDAFADG